MEWAKISLYSRKMANGISTAATSGLNLPLFLTLKNRWGVGVFVLIASAFLYLTSNWFHLFHPRLLPFSWVDQVTPFVPLTLWLYLSEYLFFIAVFVCAKDMINLNKFIYAFFAQQIFSVLIFWIFPTTYPRDLFPVPEGTDAFTLYAFQSLRSVDTPANCCPSLHVSSVFICSFIYLNEQRKKFPFFFIWATLIALSTLTTKQHYFIDVVSGALLAFAAYGIFYKLARYRELK